MNKFLLKIATLALCATGFSALALFAACGGAKGGGYPAGDYAGAENLNEPYFQVNHVELGVNEKYSAVFSETEKVTWASENEGVATVSQSGEITAVAQGSTFVKATVGGKDYKCLVVVKNTNSFISLSLDKTNISNLLVGAKSIVYATLSYQGIEGLTLEWASSDENVVKVSSCSNGGCEITAVGKGDVIVTAKYQNRVSAVCRVTVTTNDPVVFVGELLRPNGFENVDASVIDFNSITTDKSVSTEDTENKVQLTDGALFEDVDGDGKKEIVAFATLNGFDSYEIDSTFADRFAYGVLLNVFETDEAHQGYLSRNQKIYSTVEADENGNYAIVIDDVPEGIYAVQAFVEYSDDGEIVINESKSSKLFAENVNKISAIKGADDVVGRLYYGWWSSPYHFGDPYGYTEDYIKEETPTTAIDGKTPTVGYGWETDQTALTARLGVKMRVGKDGLLGYKKYAAATTLYFEVYMQNPTTYVRKVKNLVGVNADGTGQYEFIELKTNQWYTIEYDIDMLIENYDVIFNPANEMNKGLVLLATPSLNEEQKDANATNNQNVYYVGEVYFSSAEYMKEQKYGNVDKVSAIKGTENIVARIYDGWSSDIYDFSNSGDYSRLYLDATIPTEAVYGKTPTVAYNWDENKYYSIRLGVQTAFTKEDLVNYKKYSGLDTLAFELCMADGRETNSYNRKMKKLTGVNEDGSGVYEIIELKTNQWNTVEYDIDMLIENYEAIFCPSADHSGYPSGGLVLLATPNLKENNNDYWAVDYANTYYIGEIVLTKSKS